MWEELIQNARLHLKTLKIGNLIFHQEKVVAVAISKLDAKKDVRNKKNMGV